MNKNGQFTVVVAEDELIILEDISIKIEAADSCFKVEAYVCNGEEALAAIEQINPDILFTDIRMPTMDGLELISTVKKRYPGILIAIVSGYSEFSYAQKAMKFGVEDYLLKPLKKEQLAETLSEFKAKLQKKVWVIERDILSKDINGIKGINQLPSSLTNTNLALFIICIGNLQTPVVSRPSIQLKAYDMSSIDLSTILSGVLKDCIKFWIIDEKQYNQKFIILSLPHDFSGNVADLAAEIKKALENSITSFPVTICTCGQLIKSNELWEQANKLRTLLDKYLIIGCSAVLTPEIEKKLPTDYFDLLTVNRIRNLIRVKNTDLLKQELIYILSKWQEKKLPQRWIEKALIKLSKIIRAQIEMLDENDMNTIENEIYEIAASELEYSVLFNKIWQVVYGMIITNINTNDSSKKMISAAEDFIKNNYSSQINVEMLSDRFNFNPSYLIRLFKKYTGETPMQYLISMRINEAKRLIKSRPDMDLKYIAEIVGYPDQHYFSRIFKINTGMSPSEYRMKGEI